MSTFAAGGDGQEWNVLQDPLAGKIL